MVNEAPCTPGLCHLVRTEQNQIRDKLREVLGRLEQLESTICALTEHDKARAIAKDFLEAGSLGFTVNVDEKLK
jgi:hypothetical protein